MRAKKRFDFVILLKILLALALGILSVNFFDAKIRPTVMKTLITQARSLTLSCLNSAVEEVIAEFDFENIVNVSKNESEQVTAISTNAMMMNLFQVRVSERLNSAVLEMREGEIPIGSLSGLILLNGKGFKVPFRVLPLSVVDTDIESQFLSAGVNQTLHRMVLKVDTHVSAIIPTYEVESLISAEYVLAETVIVGVTPDFFVGNR